MAPAYARAASGENQKDESVAARAGLRRHHRRGPPGINTTEIRIAMVHQPMIAFVQAPDRRSSQSGGSGISPGAGNVEMKNPLLSETSLTTAFNVLKIQEQFSAIGAPDVACNLELSKHLYREEFPPTTGYCVRQANWCEWPQFAVQIKLCVAGFNVACRSPLQFRAPQGGFPSVPQEVVHV
jgi:hypothetical protein